MFNTFKREMRNNCIMLFKEEKQLLIRDLSDLRSEIQELKSEFRNQLTAERNKTLDLINAVITTPPKYKSGEYVWYGGNKHKVYRINFIGYEYFYDILLDGEYHSDKCKIPEQALYTKNK